MRIGILSDTHGLLREEVKEGLAGVDHIIHAGDIDNPGVVEALEHIAPLTIVRGNADKEWAEQIPSNTSVELGGKLFFIIHNKAGLGAVLPDCDVIVYGHTHKYSLKRSDGRIWFNPGCCGRRKKGQAVTFAIAEINDGDIIFDRVDIDNGGSPDGLPVNIDSVIKKAMKMTDNGKSPEMIARSCGISQELANEICRMYLTHPGIDVQGVITRLT
ncbi:MAG: metallophosphatase family protein [Lachnospiraceae bacterium]|nr:metallophosphatase family protein [Lachnospiraceae bacterium]